jgi:transcriptional regulator with XRE-family HTH domain
MTKKINGNTVLNNIFNLMKTKGIRQKDLAEYLGISQNAVAQWKCERTRSYMNYLDQLASYFNVSKDELLHSDNSAFETYLSQDEQELVRGYRILKNSTKNAILNLVISLSQDYQ